MADERIDSAWDIPALEKEKDNAVKLVQSWVNAVSTANQKAIKVEVQVAGAGSLKEFLSSLQGVSKADLELATAASKLSQAQSQAARAEELLTQARARGDAARQRQQQNANAANDSNVALSKTLNDLRRGYDLLTESERNNAEIGGVLQARIKQLDAQLKASDANTGRFQRNVGDYAQAYNGLGFAIRNIASELPNIGISFRTFAQSVSNNIGPLTEAIGQARTQNALLAAEGKTTIPIWKQIAGSVFSWQTAILALVAAGTYLATNLKTGSKAAQDAEKANEKYAKSLESISENSRSAAQQDIARVQILTKLASDEQQTINTRLRAIKELQDTYPTTFGSLSQQALLEGKLGDAVDKTTVALLARAAAQAAEKKFAAAGEQVYDQTLALRDQLKIVNDLQKAVDRNKNNSIGFTSVEYQFRLDQARKKYGEIRDALVKAQDAQKGFLKDMQDSVAAAGDTLLTNKLPNKAKGTTPTFSDLSEVQGQTRELAEQKKLQLQISADNLKQTADDEKQNLNVRLQAYQDYYEKIKEIEQITFQLEKDLQNEKLVEIDETEKKARDAGKLTADYERKLNEGRELARQKVVTATLQLQKSQNDALIALNQNQIKAAEQASQDEIEAVAAGLKATKAYYIQAYNERIADLKDSLNKGNITVKQFKEQERRIRTETENQILDDQLANLQEAINIIQAEGRDVSKLTDLYNQLAGTKRAVNSEGANALTGFGVTNADLARFEQGFRIVVQFQQELTKLGEIARQQTEARIASLQAEEDAIKKASQAEIDKVNRGLDAEEVKKQKVADLNTKEQVQVDAIDLKIRQQKQKQARIDKALAIAGIIAGTAQAVVSALKVTPPAGIVLAGLVGAIGLAQLAIATTTPIPEFFKGVESSPEGYALTDERGPELYIPRVGDPFIGSDKGANIKYLEKGTKIIPHDQLMKMTYAATMFNVSAYSQSKDESILADIISTEMDKQTRRLIHGMAANQSKTNIVIQTNDRSYLDLNVFR